MATLKGLAVVWGTDLRLTAADGWTTYLTGIIVESHEIGLESSQKEILNAVGDTVGLVFSNAKKALSVTLIPAHASSVTTAETYNKLPTIGDLVTIVSPNDYNPEIVEAHTGKYIFVGGSISSSQESEARMTFNLVQYVATDLSSTIT